MTRSSLSEEQRAVVIARARGSLKREAVALSLRSCYPDFIVAKNRKGVALIEEALAVEADDANGGAVDHDFEASYRSTSRTALRIRSHFQRRTWPRYLLLRGRRSVLNCLG